MSKIREILNYSQKILKSKLYREAVTELRRSPRYDPVRMVKTPDISPVDMYMIDGIIPSIITTDGVCRPFEFNKCGSVSEITIDSTNEIESCVNQYAGSFTSSGSIAFSSDNVKFSIDSTSLESDKEYVFVMVGNKKDGYYCTLNAFE